MPIVSTFPRAGLVLVLALGLPPAFAQPADTGAAEASARRSNCFKCHALDREKDGPAFKAVAARNKDKPGAEAALVQFLKTGKTPGGGSHPKVKSTDDAEITNLVRYVLSR